MKPRTIPHPAKPAGRVFSIAAALLFATAAQAQSTFVSNAVMHADLGTTWGTLPSQFQTYNAIRVFALHQNWPGGGHTSIRPTTACTIYYAHDNIHNERPTFLNDGTWTDSGMTCTPSDGVTRKLFSRSFAANTTYNYTWRHSNKAKLGSFVLGGFLVPAGVAVTLSPETYDLVSVGNYVKPASDKFIWDNAGIPAGGTTYGTIAALQTAINALPTNNPNGAILKLAAGAHNVDATITINSKQGTKTNPIYIVSETEGGAKLGGAGTAGQGVKILVTGSSQFVIIRGFDFTPQNTATGTKLEVGETCRWIAIDNCRYDGCNGSPLTTGDNWLGTSASYSFVTRITARDKQSLRPVIRIITGATTNFGSVLRDCEVINRQSLPLNGMEAYQFGHKPEHFTLFGGTTAIRLMVDGYNLNVDEGESFGDSEVISVKTEGAVLANCVFKNYKGQVTLRGTRYCFVVGNGFFGNGYERSGALHVYGNMNGGDHLVAQNYMHNINPTNNGQKCAINLNSGKGEIVNYNHWGASNSLIVGNHAYDAGIFLGFAGSDATSTPAGSIVQGNASFIGGQIIKETISASPSIRSRLSYSGNVGNSPIGDSVASGWTIASPNFTDGDGNGVYTPSHGSIAQGINDRYPVGRIGGTTIPTAGVSWDDSGGPAAPSELQATAISSTEVSLGWNDNSSNETQFRIQRKTEAGSYSLLTTKAANSTSHSDTTVSANTSYTYQVRAENANGNSSWSNEATDTTPVGGGLASLVGHWLLDETSGLSAADSSGNGSTGTLQNGPTWTTGQVDGGLSFDGANDVVNCGSGATLDNLSAVSVAAWINPITMGEGGFGRIVSKAVDPAFGSGWHFLKAGTNQLTFAVKHATTNVHRRTNPNTITTGAWQHAVVTWDGSTTGTSIKVYVNGTEVSGYDTTIDGSGARADDAASNLYLGNNSGGDRTFDGVMDDLRVYNGVLSPAEILALYEEGTAAPQPVAVPDFSPVGGTYVGTQLVTITSATSGASIRYTTDGTTPTSTTGTPYSSPVAIGSTTTLKAMAYKAGMSDSSVTVDTYTILDHAQSPFGYTISFYNVGRSKYVRADSAENYTLKADAAAAGAATKFLIVDNGDGSFSLQHTGNGKYAYPDPTTFVLSATGTIIGTEDKYTWSSNGDGTISFTSNKFTGMYVFPKSANGDRLEASGASLGSEDKYTWELTP